MSSLADLPELVGFFSYSREDDEGSDGALSALRERIQHELRAQLGRSFKNFRLWQDKEAIAAGTLWEGEIKTAVGQSAFFIPIITPTVVKSPYCQFELNSFLTREADLGRSDLIFPILYINVPALNDPEQVRADPVLSLIAKRQYVDWRVLRHQGTNSREVKEAVERVCAQVSEALRRHWLTAEERKAREEVAAREKAEAERKRREEEAKRREEEADRRAAEAQARERAEQERRRCETEAEHRAEAEQQDEGEKSSPPLVTTFSPGHKAGLFYARRSANYARIVGLVSGLVGLCAAAIGYFMFLRDPAVCRTFPLSTSGYVAVLIEDPTYSKMALAARDAVREKQITTFVKFDYDSGTNNFEPIISSIRGLQAGLIIQCGLSSDISKFQSQAKLLDY